MFKSVILHPAKDDILDAAHWYNKQQKGLGKRFTTEVREKVHLSGKTQKLLVFVIKM